MATKMKRSILAVISLLSLLSINLVGVGAEVDIDKLISSMNDMEKCGQMTQVAGSLVTNNHQDENNSTWLNYEKLHYALKERKIGSMLGLFYPYIMKIQEWQRFMFQIQNFSSKTQPETIPVLYGLDSIHAPAYIDGATFFPQPLAMASSFNLDLANRIGQIISMEHRATGSPWNFSPILDAGRHPLWPRLYETMGEDVHLIMKMSTAYMKGHHGDQNNVKHKDFRNSTRAATCLKHFMGYSFPFNGNDRTPCWLPERLMREYYVSLFENGVKLGAPTVMINSGHVNGIPGHANYHYLTEILKGELGFQGFTVTDWEDIKRLYTRDKVAESMEDAVRIAVLAGIDMSMVPLDYSFQDHCVNLLKKNWPGFRERVNDAVRRILNVKKDMGLFENPFPNPDDAKNVGTDDSHEFNLQTAEESVILAKNDADTLPLSMEDHQLNIIVTGPTANLVKVLNGGWSLGDESEYQKYGRKKYTIYESINKTATSSLANNQRHNVEFIEGANLTQLTNLDELVAAIRVQADYVVLCIGEDSYAETGGNINDLRLPKHQYQLAEAIFKVGKPVITVYTGGRPRIITSIVEQSHAALIAFLPGNRGGEAIANILFGLTNPSAKMSITYPKMPNGFTPYDHLPLETYSYLFPFGHGLSYTKFNYSDLMLSQSSLTAQEVLQVSVNVTNIGQRAGKEVVLLYLTDEYASISRPNKQLKGFTKIFLQPGSSQIVTFQLNKDDFSFVNLKNQKIYEPGTFKVAIADLSSTFQLN